MATFSLGDVIIFTIAGASLAYFFIRMGLPRIRRSLFQAAYYELQDAANFLSQSKNLTGNSQPPESPPQDKDDSKLVPV